LWAMFESGELKPVITDIYALEDYAKAYDCMIQRRARGKVMLTMD